METMTKPATRTLTVDGMTGDACVQKVTGALKNVANVTTQSVKVGTANITADQAGCTAACSAVEGAGFKCREGAATGQTNGSAQATAKVPSEGKGVNNPGAPTQKPASQNGGTANSGGHEIAADRSSGNAAAKPAVVAAGH